MQSGAGWGKASEATRRYRMGEKGLNETAGGRDEEKDQENRGARGKGRFLKAKTMTFYLVTFTLGTPPKARLFART